MFYSITNEDIAKIIFSLKATYSNEKNIKQSNMQAKKREIFGAQQRKKASKHRELCVYFYNYIINFTYIYFEYTKFNN